MKLEDLAEAIRNRLRSKGLVVEEIMARCTDLDMVESYIVCSGCGHRSLDDEQLRETVRLATNLEEWLDMTEVAYSHRH